MNRYLIIPLTITIVLAGIFSKVSATLSSVVLFIPGLIITYFIYLNTYYKQVPNPDKILPIYLLALGIQFLHFTEEYLTGFIVELPQVFGQSSYSMDYWIVFNMIAYCTFALGGIVLFKRIKELMIVPLFFMLVGVVFNAAAHILLAINAGGYFPGLYTALIYALIAPIVLRAIFEKT